MVLDILLDTNPGGRSTVSSLRWGWWVGDKKERKRRRRWNGRRLKIVGRGRWMNSTPRRRRKTWHNYPTYLYTLLLRNMTRAFAALAIHL
jgi:hypothetical protein